MGKRPRSDATRSRDQRDHASRGEATAPGAPGRRVRWTRRTGAWIGIGTGPGVLMVGAGLAKTAGGTVALAGILVGAIALYLVCVAHGLSAQVSPIPMGTKVRAIFGDDVTPLLLIGALVIAMLGWCGFYLGLGGAALSDLFGLSQVGASAALGGVVVALALLGQDRWNVLLYATATCAVALTVFTVVAVTPSSTPVAAAGDWRLRLLEAVGGTVVYGIVFAMRVPDFTTDLARPGDVWRVGLTMVIPLVLLAALGVWLYQRTGVFNMADVLRETSHPEAGQLFLTLSAVAPAVTAVYSCSVSVNSMAALGERWTMVIAGTLAVLLGATRFDRSLLGFLQALSVVIPPALTVILVGARLQPQPAPPHPGVAWVLGSLVAFILRPVAALAGFLAGCVMTLAWLLAAARRARTTRP